MSGPLDWLMPSMFAQQPTQMPAYGWSPQQPDQSNYNAAKSAMNLTPQEQSLYQMHLNNLYGPGGVDNADGSRSSLYQAVEPHNGQFYNIPTVWNGSIETQPWTRPSDGQQFNIPNQTALSNVAQMGWQNFPAYSTPQQADARYGQMHDYMERDTGRFFDLRRGAR